MDLGIVLVRNSDHSWDIDHPRDGGQLRDGNLSMKICVNLEYINHYLQG